MVTRPRSAGGGHRSRRVVAATIRLVGRVVSGSFVLAILLVVIVGLPVALVNFVGWPLLDHVPTRDEIQMTLLSPLSPSLLLDVLACVMWLLWAWFIADLLAVIRDVVRDAPWRGSLRDLRHGPLHTVAAALAGGIVLSILSSRTSAPAAAAQTVTTEFSNGEHTTVATASYHPATAHDDESARAPVVAADLHTQVSTSSLPGTETVREAEQGVHDSLWRIAQRCLGDGKRWPEIWKLNQGTVQLDGKVFNKPSLIQPGWQLHLPDTFSATPPPAPETPAPQDPSDQPAPGHQDRPAEPIPTTEQSKTTAQAAAEQPAPTADPGTGITLATGAFVGLGLAALITVAMVTTRLRRRRRYQPATPEPGDPGRTPVVRALRIAHDAATRPHDGDATTAPSLFVAGSRPADLDLRERAQATARAVLPTPDQTVLGLRQGHAVALDLAHSRGLGLVGPGARAAARALIVTVLARAAEDGLDALIIILAADADTLFGTDLPPGIPAGLRIVDDLPSALDILEAELVARVRDDEADDLDFSLDERHDRGPLVLVASSSSDTERRTQAVIDNGCSLGLAGVLLGQWRPGGTAMVGDDGTVAATCPALTDSLAGARLFTLPATDTADLLALLEATEPRRDQGTPDRNGGTPHTADSADRSPAATSLPDAPPPGMVIDIPNRNDEASASSGEAPDGSNTPSSEASDSTSIADHSQASPEAAVTPERTSLRRPALDVSDAPPLHLQVFGRLHLTRTDREPVDVIEVLAPRQREILVYLALHREGSRREALTAALWPDAPTDRPYNSFHATLSQLRRGLRTATENELANITINHDGHYRLDGSLVSVDLWQAHDALSARRHAVTPDEKLAAVHRVTELYQGDLADGICADWIDGPREALRRDVLDALSGLIRTIGNDNPEQTLVLLEQARGLDPYNEAIYRDLMRTQARLGHYDSIPRTLGLLTSSLNTLDQQPTRDTLGLADFLRGPAANCEARKQAELKSCAEVSKKD